MKIKEQQTRSGCGLRVVLLLLVLRLYCIERLVGMLNIGVVRLIINLVIASRRGASSRLCRGRSHRAGHEGVGSRAHCVGGIGNIVVEIDSCALGNQRAENKMAEGNSSQTKLMRTEHFQSLGRILSDGQNNRHRVHDLEQCLVRAFDLEARVFRQVRACKTMEGINHLERKLKDQVMTLD